MKNLLWPLVSILFFVSCQKEEIDIYTIGVPYNDLPPVPSFDVLPNNGCLGDLYPGVSVTLKSTATDDGNNIKEYKWSVNGEEFTGKDITVTLLNEGINQIVHIVKDKANPPQERTKPLLVKPFPRRIKARLTGVYTGLDVGDGVDKPGNVFLVVNSLREKENGRLEIVNQNVYPSGAPASYTFTLPSASYIDFSDRGVILYEGKFNDRWGVSFVASEYDPASSCWVCDFLGNVFPIAGAIVEVYYPGASAVGSAAGEISKKVGDYISDDENATVISHIELEHGPEDVWNYGCKQYAHFGALSIEYIVEPIP
ncbi:MAG: hypothetical protein ACKVU0_19090 [Saprospiraceae bacterium]